MYFLKWKVSRLRDWNRALCDQSVHPQKLEMKSISITRLKRKLLCSLEQLKRLLEMKSISITRLKRKVRLLNWWSRHTWNEKYLDYEIETEHCLLNTNATEILEMKSISITRLKLWRRSRGCRRGSRGHLKWKVSRLRDWNLILNFIANRRAFPWNEKYLDYEIETARMRPPSSSTSSLEMKSISITRLKQCVVA